MGISVSDVVTSAPSVWGATNAAAASTVFPLAAFVALPLATLVSDPAQMWHAGERYGNIAGRIRSASEDMTKAVEHHASADRWSERGKDAFLANRVKPYQDTLEQAAAMYDNIDGTLKGCAIGYSALGLSSAVIGSAVLDYVARMLAMAAIPGANVQTTFVTNVEMLDAAKYAKNLINGIAKVNGIATTIIDVLTSSSVSAKAVLGTLGAGGAALGGYYVGSRASHGFAKTETTLDWPKQLAPGVTLPAGYRAPSAADQSAIKKIEPASITALGKDLDAGAAETLGAAYEDTRGNDVGYPGFGVVGLHLTHAHSKMRDHAAEQLAASRDTPGTWLPGLRTHSGNWIFAEQTGTDEVRHGRHGK
ncbi:hypothetical protein [Actinomadura sp. DC4]|uniref:hypothetical protein n=1 Tax=Actinomadura sp. DC4 TaxID=3055069 RepID=UPI0025B0E864|nr:hypothetical protein [Actinomadura sp. DC4]MDN3354283.1 hypothetical protein [Actinomadura sp. DC4]